MVKRGENIYKRKDGRWEGRYKKSRNSEGKVVYGYVYGKKYGEVKLALSQKRITLELSEDKKFTGNVAEWIDFWLYKETVKTIRPSTKASYESKIRNYIKPMLGHIRLNMLTNKDINNFIIFLQNKNFAKNTVKTTLSILKSSLNYAVRHEFLEKSPYFNIHPPKGKERKISSLTVDQQKKLEEQAFQESGCSAIILSLSTGMRIGEICGLKWEDIDFQNNVIEIKRTLQRVANLSGEQKTRIVIGAPKTESSIRKIPLGTRLKKYLIDKKHESYSEFVVSCNKGFAEPRVISYRFKRIAENSNIPDVNFHSLRHTFATRCIENGIDISAVSKLLGHTSTRLTLDMYVDSMWEHRTVAISIIDSVVFDD